MVLSKDPLKGGLDPEKGRNGFYLDQETSFPLKFSVYVIKNYFFNFNSYKHPSQKLCSFKVYWIVMYT